ncbi:MAG: cytochrome c biogenesis protein CcsA [Planctomycetota bacterium]
MATADSLITDLPARSVPRHRSQSDSTSSVWTALQYLGSLKLAVTLFALSMVLVLVGTLAQDELNMLQVKERYFVCWIAELHFDDFFPRAFFLDDKEFTAWIPFPGGKTIGVLLFFNLLAAKFTRFKVKTSGSRLALGTVFLSLGLVLTGLLVVGGQTDEGLQGNPPAWLTYNMLWSFVLMLEAAAAAALGYAAIQAKTSLGRWFAALASASVAALLIAGLMGMRIDDSGLRIVWQLAKGAGAGVILLVGSVLVFGKQGGNLLLHFGVALLMFGQFAFGDRQLEQRLNLIEGEVSNTLVNMDQLEFHVMREESDKTRVTAVPIDLLLAAKETPLSHPALPFDVKLLEFFANSDLTRVRSGSEAGASAAASNPATTGFGTVWRAMEIPDADPTSGRSNTASAYVELLDKQSGESIGKFMLSQWLSDARALVVTEKEDVFENVRRGDESYQIALRFGRTVKPYWVKLKDVERIDYSGTETPRDFSSHIRIIDRELDQDRNERVWMNNPLRFRGETFYQSSYSPLPSGKELTQIQVVKNGGWLIPYVACSITAIGMLAHFLGTLTRFVSRRSREERKLSKAAGSRGIDPASRGNASKDNPYGVDKQAAAKTKASNPDPGLSPKDDDSAPKKRRIAPDKLAAYVGTALALGLVVYTLVPWQSVRFGWRPNERLQTFDTYEMGKIPVQFGGRIMPLDAYAKQTLKTISNRESLEVDVHTPVGIKARAGDSGKVTALQWLLELAGGNREMDDLRMVRIDAQEVLADLNLQRRSSKLFSLNEIEPRFKEMLDQINKISAKPSDQRDFKENKLLKLAQRLRTYRMARESFQTPRRQPIPIELVRQRFPTATQRDVDEISDELLSRHLEEVALTGPGLIPPKASAVQPSGNAPQWVPFSTAYFRQLREQESLSGGVAKTDAALLPGVTTFVEMVAGFSEEQRDPAAFNKAVDDHLEAVQGQVALIDEKLASISEDVSAGHNASLVRLERWMTGKHPTHIALMIYLLGLATGIVYLMSGWNSLRSGTLSALFVAFVLHTVVIVCRISITGRAPVINLYSSAVFIGWAVVLFGLAMECIFRYGIGNLFASFTGTLSLLVAYGLTFTTGDTMPVLQAVLDTQFWLATHVITVSLGYFATLAAGTMGIGYLVARWMPNNEMTTKAKDILYRCIYGAACFGILFSFVGTVLGGLWADDSWGRFWGWDPKENGALLIVIWNALMLHARWDKMVGPRGFAVLSIGGNVVTAWSWFGTNELGIGLHSYGFTEGVLFWLGLYIASQLAFVVFDMGERLFKAFMTPDPAASS